MNARPTPGARPATAIAIASAVDPDEDDGDTAPVVSAHLHGLVACERCGLVSQVRLPPAMVPAARDAVRDLPHIPADEAALCPRCDAPLHLGKAASLQRTWAYLFASVVMYVPANAMPIMETSTVIGDSSHTIIGGIGELWVGGTWELAVIVFIASIAVPILKIGSLAYLAWTAGHASLRRKRERSRLYRIVENVGHWSMLDVFVVVLLAAMIRFGSIASVQPQPGLLAFGAVVILTMLASSSFDPRLIWSPSDAIHDVPGEAPGPTDASSDSPPADPLLASARPPPPP
jgi:paraquat-inducible protein A